MIDSVDAVPTSVPRRLATLPRFGALAALFALLLGALSFLVPIDSNFDELPGGTAPGAGMPPRCLALSGFPAKNYRWFPREIRLMPERVAPSLSWYRLRSRNGTNFGWRPAGPDSLDITGVHGPRLRFPNRGSPMVGRGGWPVFATLWEALADRQWRMEAREITCPADLLENREEIR
jgi:hypothetical protein